MAKVEYLLNEIKKATDKRFEVLKQANMDFTTKNRGLDTIIEIKVHDEYDDKFTIKLCIGGWILETENGKSIGMVHGEWDFTDTRIILTDEEGIDVYAISFSNSLLEEL